MSRRRFLSGVGAGVAGVVAASRSGSARALDVAPGEEIGPHLESISDGETVVIPPGTYTYSDGDIDADGFELRTEGLVTWDVRGKQELAIDGIGWSFGGVNFDIRGRGSHLQVELYGADWRFHNCAWTGVKTGIGYFVYPACDAGASGLVDECYMGDGQADDVADSYVFTYNGTDGAIEIRRSYFDQGGVYGADTQDPPEQEGTVDLTDCYFRNAYLACIRTGMIGRTARIRNCTMVYDSRTATPDVPEKGTSLPTPGVRSFRGIWGFWGDVVAEDCDVSVPYGVGVTTSRFGDPRVLVRNSEVAAATRKDGNVTFENVGSNPDVTPPESCVTSAAEAVTGSPNAVLPESLRVNATGNGTDSESEPGPDPEAEPELEPEPERREGFPATRFVAVVAVAVLVALALPALAPLVAFVVLYLLLH